MTEENEFICLRIYNNHINLLVGIGYHFSSCLLLHTITRIKSSTIRFEK